MAKARAMTVVRDQILPHFDQHMRQSAFGAMAVETVILQGAMIRLIVADVKSSLRQPRHQGDGQPPILIPQHAQLPWSGNALPGRRETVKRNQNRISQPVDLRRDGVMIRRVEQRDPPRQLRGIHRPVARDDAAVRQFHHQGGIVGAAIKINQQARPAPQHRGGAIGPSQRPGDLGGADVIGDMGFEQAPLQPQAPISSGQGVGGMIAHQQQRRRGGCRDQFEGRFGHGHVIFLSTQAAHKETR